MSDEDKNDKEKEPELTAEAEGEEIKKGEEAEIGETDTVAEEVGVEGEQPEAEEPPLPSDADPFLLRLLRCEGLIKRLGSS